ncbi:hypothetical protein [Halalkalirubrum salinum]|uniref:hypothetical protein n=1 Tax=Halalkalirubrum salinum TaxID=2563889 RepID=UPI0014859C33|nr:hypothetical protein [Halalkalirubrum salinum]
MTISFKQWTTETVSNIRESNQPLPIRIFRPIYYIYVAFLLTLTRWRPFGTNIFERDWDTLIILDACRVDALREVEDEYKFLTVNDSITSVGSTSFEWLNHTFDKKYQEKIQQTAYVTGNGYTERVFEENGYTGNAAIPFGPSEYSVVDTDDFKYLEELWRADFQDSSEWIVGSGDVTRIHPRYTTDRAIRASRESDANKLIIHYMYPHTPYPLAEDPDLRDPFEPLRAGKLSKQEVWDEYLDNLRFVLDEVEKLLENIDAESVAITADHGEAFGEFGMYWHFIGCPLPVMRRVPWAKATAHNSGEYEPSAPAPDSMAGSTTAEQQLKQLGYL